MTSDFICMHMGIFTVSYFDWNKYPLTYKDVQKIAKSNRLFVLIKMQLCQGYHYF